MFVAVGDSGTIMTGNESGYGWTVQSTLYPGPLYDIINGIGDEYYISGMASGVSGLWRSSDLTSFETIPFSLSGVTSGTPITALMCNSSQTKMVAVARNGRFFSSTNGTSWAVASFDASSLTVYDALYADGLYVAIGMGPSYAFAWAVSSDGDNFEYHSQDNNQAYGFRVTNHSGIWVAAGDDGQLSNAVPGNVWVSSDALTWEFTQIWSSFDGGAIQWLENYAQYLIVGYDWRLHFFVSSDASSGTWERIPPYNYEVFGAPECHALAVKGSTVIIGGRAGLLQATNNLSSWENVFPLTTALFVTNEIIYHSPTSYDYYQDPTPSTLGRGFYIGASDYTERVLRWPRIRRSSREIKSVTIEVPISNADGALNHFHLNRYTMPNTCLLRLDIASQTNTLFTGFLKDVGYNKMECTLTLMDRLYNMAERKVGEGAAPVEFTNVRPSVIAWNLCTSYGNMSAIESTSNPDIHYARWLTYDQDMIANNVLCSARYDGIKIYEALQKLGEMTDTGIWVDAEGRINFLRNTVTSTLDQTLTWDDWTEVGLNVEGYMVVNRQSIDLLYNENSFGFGATITYEDGASINSFGLRDDLLSDDALWFVSSISALTIAAQRVQRRAQPPERFTIDTGLIGIRRQLGETVRMVDSFFSVTSATGWRVVDQDIDLESGAVRYEVEGELGYSGFYLDVSCLDGSERLI